MAFQFPVCKTNKQVIRHFHGGLCSWTGYFGLAASHYGCWKLGGKESKVPEAQVKNITPQLVGNLFKKSSKKPVGKVDMSFDTTFSSANQLNS